MYNHHINSSYWLMQPEYFALLISVIAIFINLYMSKKNREHILAKELYFKYQQNSEKIISKLLILQNQRNKFDIWINNQHRANTEDKTIFIDSNDTLNKALFEENAHEIAALIQIYFPNIWDKWNDCLTSMGKLLSMLIILNIKIQKQEKIDWNKEIKSYEAEQKKLWEIPQELTLEIIKELKQFKQDNLD